MRQLPFGTLSMEVHANPDTRPLPPGWNQHYDAQRQTWYYICANVNPPQVTIAHPLGPLPPRSFTDPAPTPEYTVDIHEAMLTEPEPSTFSQLQFPTGPRSSGIQPRKSGLSFAQKLYASSAHDPGPHAPATGILTPPASPLGSTPAVTSAIVTNQQSATPPKSHSSGSTLGLDTYHYLDTSGHQPRSLNESHTAFSSHLSSGNHIPSPHHHAPHRTMSYQSASTPHTITSPHHHHRASTLPTNDLQTTRALRTTLRAPPAKFPASAAPSPQLNLQNAGWNVPSYPSPPSSLPSPAPTFSPQANAPYPSLAQHNPQNIANHPYPSPPASHLSPTSPTTVNPTSPYQQQQQQQQGQQQVPSKAFATSPLQILPQNHQQQQLQQQAGTVPNATLEVGKTLGKFALKVAGGALAVSMGIPPTIVPGIGGKLGGALANGADSGDFVGSLANGLQASAVQAVHQHLQPKPPAPNAHLGLLLLQQQQQQAQANAQGMMGIQMHNGMANNANTQSVMLQAQMAAYRQQQMQMQLQQQHMQMQLQHQVQHQLQQQFQQATQQMDQGTQFTQGLDLFGGGGDGQSSLLTGLGSFDSGGWNIDSGSTDYSYNMDNI